ncbi:hypothetical protein DPMN_003599 [Dreissena polymorpha]|uniref:Uncharacterized protein n=1 Tax=Dreissena polymorpha TaxID=45954 RepID=A0A9D4MM30_DREPO|nr:hypothetical protein DPMN_003599 [Dreissena polymorpha]
MYLMLVGGMPAGSSGATGSDKQQNVLNNGVVDISTTPRAGLIKIGAKSSLAFEIQEFNDPVLEIFKILKS